MSYSTGPIRNIRTIKAIRGESLTIDLGEVQQGELRSWMKKDPNDSTYRSFSIIGNRYLQLSKEKASDYYDNEGQLIEAVEGRWYFDVEQILDPSKPEEVQTIYRGTIKFSNDITGSVGVEIDDPNLGFNTFIGLYDTPNNWGAPGQMLVVNLAANALIWVDAPDGATTEEIIATVDVGGISIGEAVPSNSSLTQFVKQLVSPTVLPTILANRSLSLSGVSAATIEIGTVFNDDLNYAFNRGTIESKNGSPNVDLVGAEVGRVFSGNGINASTGIISTPILNGSNQWSLLLNYAQGIAPYYDSDGNVASNLDAQRVAGSVSANSPIITGRYRYWYGVGAEGSTPITSAAIRALPNNGFANNLTFDISIPANTKEVAIYLPSTMTLVSVLYVQSANANVTGTFTSSTVNVNDGGGNSVNYNKFKTVIGGIGYPSVATYRVTINL